MVITRAAKLLHILQALLMDLLMWLPDSTAIFKFGYGSGTENLVMEFARSMSHISMD